MTSWTDPKSFPSPEAEQPAGAGAPAGELIACDRCGNEYRTSAPFRPDAKYLCPPCVGYIERLAKRAMSGSDRGRWEQ